MSKSIYATVLGEDFQRLHPKIQERFGFDSKSNKRAIGRVDHFADHGDEDMGMSRGRPGDREQACNGKKSGTDGVCAHDREYSIDWGIMQAGILAITDS